VLVPLSVTPMSAPASTATIPPTIAAASATTTYVEGRRTDRTV